jgi:hypothetical protein
MSSGGVPLWVPLVVALVGLAGVLTAQTLANRRDDRRWILERSEWRRRELASAVAAFASAVSELIRAEVDRSLERIDRVPEPKRQPGKQKTYQLRAEAQSHRYLVMLLADQQKHQGLGQELADVIEKCHEITKQSRDDKAELYDYEQVAREAVDKLVRDASRRIWSD